MAPIYGSQKFLDDLTTTVSPSVVIVRSFEVRMFIDQQGDLKGLKRRERDLYIHAHMQPYHYKSCTGFIIGVRKMNIFVAVHRSQITPADNDVLRVRFYDNNEQAAGIFIKKIKSFMILRVDQPDHPYQPVRLCDTKIDREDILILSNVAMRGLNPYRSSIINPRTATIAKPADSNNIIKKSGQFFTFGCTAKIEDLLGAPVFNFSGVFVGAVDTNHHIMCGGSGPSDLIYARHVRYFFHKATGKIKVKAKKLIKKRKRKMSEQKKQEEGS